MESGNTPLLSRTNNYRAESQAIKRETVAAVSRGAGACIITSAMRIPLFPLDAVLFPGASLPLHIFEDRYREMIAECLDGDRVFGVVRAQQDGLAVIGCTAHIVRILERYPDGRMEILCQGVERFEIEMLDNSRTFLQAEVDLLPDQGEDASRRDREECLSLHYEALELVGVEPVPSQIDLDRPISFHLANSIPADLALMQELLCMRSDAERTLRLLAFYRAILPKLRRGAQAALGARHNGHVM